MLIRLKYSKTAAGRFISHLDMLRTFERIFRRAALPLAFSEGFNPHPKISFGSALAVGITSDAEYLDVELQKEIEPDKTLEDIARCSPGGINILELKVLSERQRSLNAQINMASYELRIPLTKEPEEENVRKLFKDLLDKKNIFVSREGKRGIKQVDIRQGIYALSGAIEKNELVVYMEVQTGSEGNVRPEEILLLLVKNGEFLEEKGFQINRIGLFIRDAKGARTPLE